MPNAIRLIAVDLDGTLLNSQKRISDADREALEAARARGVEIVPVTGRNYTFALPIIQRLPFDVPLIASNGALIRSTRGETFLRCLLPQATAAAVLQAARQFRPFTVLMYDQAGPGQLRIETPPNGGPANEGHGPRSRGVAFSSWAQRHLSLIHFVGSLEEALDGDPLEVLFTGPAAVMRQAAATLESSAGASPRVIGTEGQDLVYPAFRLLLTEYREQDFSILDVIRGDCSKGLALAYWSRRRGISSAQIMAIGDNYNDVEMLRFAGLPVVMGNADPDLKQQGWTTTLDCDSGGVAHAIQQYVL